MVFVNFYINKKNVTMGTEKNLPNDAHVIKLMLKESGINDFEPKVINQLLELSYRYVTDVLEESQLFSRHAGKKSIDCDDVKIAVQSKLDRSFTTPPPRELLMELAKHKNSTNLPVIKPYTGLKLPPDRYCMSAANFQVKYQKNLRGIGLPQLTPGSSSTSVITQQYSGGSGSFLD